MGDFDNVEKEWRIAGKILLNGSEGYFSTVTRGEGEYQSVDANIVKNLIVAAHGHFLFTFFF